MATNLNLAKYRQRLPLIMGEVDRVLKTEYGGQMITLHENEYEGPMIHRIKISLWITDTAGNYRPFNIRLKLTPLMIGNADKQAFDAIIAEQLELVRGAVNKKLASKTDQIIIPQKYTLLKPRG